MNGAYGAKGTRGAFVPGMNGAEGAVPTACAPSFVLGTAGHIDHGKSALVKALTGTDPDRLEEEKRRGITIELGFAQMVLPDGTRMGVVDVPGHERFVRQMIAGATGVDLALLCVAADDGVMPQTDEHLSVLELLGVARCVVALTKTDLVDDEWAAFMADEVRARLRGTPYADASVVPVSARTGAGLDELRAALVAATCGLARTKGGADLRLPVDRVFSVRGSGTVVTGTLWSGRVAAGDEVEILPGSVCARVRGVQEHGVPVDVAEAGNRVALNLGAASTADVRPGMFLAAPGSVRPTDRFDAWVAYLGAGARGERLETGTRVRVAHGTAEVAGRVLFMDGCAAVQPREGAYAQIRLDDPLPLSGGDRFVVRSMTPVHVVGGGQVLHAHPRRRTNLREGERGLLDALRTGDVAAACAAAHSLTKGPTPAEAVAAVAGIAPADARRRLEDRVAAGEAVSIGLAGAPCYATRGVLQRQLAALENALLRFHAERPDTPGASKAALRDLLPGHVSDQAFDALVEHARAEGLVVVAEGLVGHPKAAGTARRREEQAAETLAAVLARAASAPPAVADLFKQAGLDASLGHRALGVLEKQGRARRVSGDFAFDADACAALERAVVDRLRACPGATAAELKNAMGVSRKHAIPLLEHFDAQGITKRDGDVRTLGPKGA